MKRHLPYLLPYFSLIEREKPVFIFVKRESAIFLSRKTMGNNASCLYVKNCSLLPRYH